MKDVIGDGERPPLNLIAKITIAAIKAIRIKFLHMIFLLTPIHNNTANSP
jgi:hypothetical protein